MADVKVAVNASKEYFEIIFFSMGQGDCSLIKCPNGKLIMIDCGSSAYFQQDKLAPFIIDQIREWTDSNANKIDVLIFTHPDKDHYNQLEYLLNAWKKTDLQTLGSKNTKDLPAITIEKVYFSRVTEKNDNPLIDYAQNGVNNAIYKKIFGTTSINEIIINSTQNNFVNTWFDDSGFQKIHDQNLKKNNVVLLEGTTVAHKKWSVSIIAGGVGGYEKTALGTNTVSLVTLVNFDNHKLLVCGDATTDTEEFLIKEHSNELKNLAIVQIPHHGSETSSSEDFVKLTKPGTAVVSVGFMEHSFKLPRKNRLDRWLDPDIGGLDDKAATTPHHIDSWSLPEEVGYDEKDFKETLFKKQDYVGTIDLVNTKTDGFESLDKKTEIVLHKTGNNVNCFWIQETKDIQDNSYYAVTNTGYCLYREGCKQPLWQTSTLGQGFNFLYFKLPNS